MKPKSEKSSNNIILLQSLCSKPFFFIRDPVTRKTEKGSVAVYIIKFNELAQIFLYQEILKRIF